jgi:5-formyltetrahydrofolate cyclo-ligase
MEQSYFNRINLSDLLTKITKMTVAAEKKLLREAMLKQREAMPRQERKAHSDAICQQLWGLVQEREARVVHSYLTMGAEVNVLPLLEKLLAAGIQVVVPKTLKKRQMQNLVLKSLQDMEPGIFGTYHPKNGLEHRGTYDLVIVAGLAFDQQGYRVGYGGGYYDTFLAAEPDAYKVGVCFPFQMMEKVPVEAHDIRLDKVLF